MRLKPLIDQVREKLSGFLALWPEHPALAQVNTTQAGRELAREYHLWRQLYKVGGGGHPEKNRKKPINPSNLKIASVLIGFNRV